MMSECVDGIKPYTGTSPPPFLHFWREIWVIDTEVDFRFLRTTVPILGVILLLDRKG